DYIDVCHRSSLFMPAIDATNPDFVRLRYPVRSPRSWLSKNKQIQRDFACFLYFFFGEAFFDAFNASFVASPANPRRSRGGAFAFEIKTYPSRGPGTAPSTRRRLSSRSMARMRRLRTVTCSCPMWPGMRWPGKTREGKDDAPMDPCTWNMWP